jgi:hypothetical protein
MKKHSFLLVVCALFLGTLTINAQNDSENIPKGTQTINGIFDGFDVDEFSFICKDAKGEEETMFFDKITAEALKMVNLKDNKFVGTMFEVTYTVTLQDEEDEDGETVQMVIKTITGVKKI